MEEVKFSKKQLRTFEELGIRLIYLFGSQIDGTQNKLSDIDVGVVFDNLSDDEIKDKEERYTQLFDIFTDIFRQFKKVDLVFLQETSLMLQSNVVFNGKVIYKSDDVVEFDYKELVMKYHADTQYFRKQRQERILERI